MTVAQVYQIVNTAFQMATGGTEIEAVDTSSFIAMGDKILSSDKDNDAFNNAMMDVIGITVISNRVYRASEESGMIKKPFEWGAIMRKYYVEVGDAETNYAWEIGKTSYTPTFAPIMKPEIKQYLFDSIATFEYGVTIPDDIWSTAFHNEMEMASLISAIYTSLDLKMTVALENLSLLTRAAYIARVIKNGGKNAVNLLALYKTASGNTTITAEKAILDKEFIRWSNRLLYLYTKRIAKPSRMFNQASNLHHTPREYQVLDVIADYAASSASYLESDTYHDKLVKMPYYNEVTYWQGTGEDYAFKDVSTVSVKLNKADTEATTYPYVIAILYDIEAMGVTLDKPRNVAERNNRDEYTDMWTKANRGYFNDMQENAIVFYLA